MIALPNCAAGTPPPSALLLLTIQAVILLTSKPMGHMLMNRDPKSPSSLVFYSLSFSVLPTDLITITHGKVVSFLNFVFHYSLGMRHNLLKPSHFLSWIWNTPSTCLFPLSLVSSPGLFKFLSTASLTPLDGPVLTPNP